MKVPPLLPRFLKVPGGRRFVPLEQVIAAHLDRLFPGMKIVAHHPFRVTRDADIEVEVDEAEDLLETLESLLRGRQQRPEAVRLEVASSMPEETQEAPAAGAPALAQRPLRDRRPARPRRSLAARRAQSSGAEGKPWLGVTPPELGASRDTTGGDFFAALRQQRRARPPPVRPLRDDGRGVRPPGRRRPGRARDQADALPHVGRGRGADRRTR